MRNSPNQGVMATDRHTTPLKDYPIFNTIVSDDQSDTLIITNIRLLYSVYFYFCF